MIHVTIQQEENSILRLEVTGHAGQAEPGKDLVCASVSSIMFGCLNALEELHGVYQETLEDNKIVIQNCGQDRLTQTILATVVVQLQTLEEAQGAYIKINKEG